MTVKPADRDLWVDPRADRPGTHRVLPSLSGGSARAERRISHVNTIPSVATRDRDSRHRAVRDAATGQVAVTADQDSVVNIHPYCRLGGHTDRGAGTSRRSGHWDADHGLQAPATQAKQPTRAPCTKPWSTLA